MGESKAHPIFNGFKKLISVFFKAPEVKIEGEDMNGGPYMYLANHVAASGPFKYELFFPCSFRPWGTHEMCGDYKERWNYLYHVFYIQKKGYSKFKAFIISTLFALISKLLYNGAELIPTYKDARLKKTIALSLETLSEGKSLLIFPEDSNAGYKEVIEKFFGGFLVVAQRYNKLYGKDIPIRCVYFNKNKNVISVGAPITLSEAVAHTGTDNKEVLADFFRQRTNALA